MHKEAHKARYKRCIKLVILLCEKVVLRNKQSYFEGGSGGGGGGTPGGAGDLELYNIFIFLLLSLVLASRSLYAGPKHSQDRSRALHSTSIKRNNATA